MDQLKKDVNEIVGLDILIKAADYIETCENEKRHRESDHGYASTYRYIDDNEPLHKRVKITKKNQSRTSHNELEKNRRAHLRNCLDNLKAIVPLGQDASRHTTLGLLNKATSLIEDLERQQKIYNKQKSDLSNHNEQLKHLLLGLELSSRIRHDSTNSIGLSDLSTDSDKEEIIDVTECSSSGDELIQELIGMKTMPAEMVIMS
uniref:BHLH transcription factor MAD n=1 Tax=Molgula tectiformis TaxID=30286 RepID=A0A9R4_MOLTE|nr:bHLH transcription factor MAD [Molgula tectiformis]